MDKKYAVFEDLPEFIQEYISQIVGEATKESWIRKSVPELSNRNLLKAANQNGIFLYSEVDLPSFTYQILCTK